MRTTADTRRVERRYPAAQRRYRQALKKYIDDGVLTSEHTYYEFKPTKDTVEITTFFRLPGDSTKYRFDYEIDLTQHLPRVSYIRVLLWRSFVNYQKQYPGVSGVIRASTRKPYQISRQ